MVYKPSFTLLACLLLIVAAFGCSNDATVVAPDDNITVAAAETELFTMGAPALNSASNALAASGVKAVAIRVKDQLPNHPDFPIYDIWTSDEVWETHKEHFVTGDFIRWVTSIEHIGGALHYDVGIFRIGSKRPDAVFSYDFNLEPGWWYIGIYLNEVPDMPGMPLNWGVRTISQAGTYIHGLPLGEHWFDVNMP